MPTAAEIRIAEQDYAASVAETAERLKNQVTFAESIFKGLTLTNGGAIIALFTFIGNHDAAAKQGMALSKSALWWAFGSFTVGLVATLVAVTCAFFSQLRFYNSSQFQAWNAQAVMHGTGASFDAEGEVGAGNRFLGGGIFAAVVGLASFIVGSAFALAGVLP